VKDKKEANIIHQTGPDFKNFIKGLESFVAGREPGEGPGAAKAGFSENKENQKVKDIFETIFSPEEIKDSIYKLIPDATKAEKAGVAMEKAKSTILGQAEIDHWDKLENSEIKKRIREVFYSVVENLFKESKLFTLKRFLNNIYRISQPEIKKEEPVKTNEEEKKLEPEKEKKEKSNSDISKKDFNNKYATFLKTDLFDSEGNRLNIVGMDEKGTKIAFSPKDSKDRKKYKNGYEIKFLSSLVELDKLLKEYKKPEKEKEKSKEEKDKEKKEKSEEEGKKIVQDLIAAHSEFIGKNRFNDAGKWIFVSNDSINYKKQEVKIIQGEGEKINKEKLILTFDKLADILDEYNFFRSPHEEKVPEIKEEIVIPKEPEQKNEVKLEEPSKTGKEKSSEEIFSEKISKVSRWSDFYKLLKSKEGVEKGIDFSKIESAVEFLTDKARSIENWSDFETTFHFEIDSIIEDFGIRQKVLELIQKDWQSFQKEIEIEKEKSIREARSFEELYQVLEKIGSIKSRSSDRIFSAKEMKDRIEFARKEGTDLSNEEWKNEKETERLILFNIIRTYGLREKVKDLIDNERENMEKQAETKEITEEKIEEEKEPEEIKELRDKLTEARNLYARKNYEVTDVMSRIKKILRFKLSSSKVDSVNNAYEEYNRANNVLLEAKINDFKKRNLNLDDLRKEMGGLVQYFNVDERRMLAEARTSSRAEASDGKLKWALEKSSEAINWYRKLNWKKKVSVSVGLMAIGATGALATGVGFGAAAVYRAFAGTAAGVGLTGTLEASYRKKEEEKSEKRKKEILKESEIADGEDSDYKLDLLMEKLSVDIADSDQTLKREIDQATKRKLIGAGAAILLGSGALNWMIEKSGVGSWVMEKLGLSSDEVVGKATDSGGENFNPAQVELNNLDGGVIPEIPGAENIVSEVGQGSELTINSGSSLEGTLIDHFQNQGMDLEEAGKQASRLAKSYAESQGMDYSDLNSTYPGQEIILNADGDQIQTLTETLDSRAMSAIREISEKSNEAWRGMKNINFEDLKNGKPKIFENANKVLEKYKEILGSEAIPKKAETIQKWVARIAKAATNKTK